MFNRKSFQVALLICLSAVGQSFANGELGKTGCGLETRVKRLEEKAVTTDTLKLTFEGWVNRAVQWADNGFHSNTSYISPGNVTSNLQITGMVDPVPDFTLGTQVQLDFNQNGNASRTSDSSVVDIHLAQTGLQSEQGISVRQSEVTADSKTFGKLYLGRGYMASTGVIYYTDLSGTYFFLHPYSSIGGISFRNDADGTPFNNNPLNPGRTLKPGILIFESGDGGSILGRNDRIRYDSPNYYGFNISTSHGYQNVGDIFDVALKFAAILAGTTIVAQTSWARNYTRDYIQGFNFNQNATVLGASPLYRGPKFDTTNAAIGILSPFSMSGKQGTGFNVHFSWARRKWKLENQSNGLALQGKVGYLDEFFPIGKTAFVVSVGQWKAMDIDFWTNVSPLVPGSTGTGGKITLLGKNWGTGLVQSIDAVGASLYLRYDNYKLTRKHTQDKYRDVNIVYGGAMIKF